MYTILIVSVIAFFAVLLNTILTVIGDDKQRKNMIKKENQLKEANISPYGSTLSHGMAINRKTNKLVADQKPSIMWYKRLI